MALQLNNKKPSKLKLSGVSGAVIVGATILLFRTFPHLKYSIYDYITGNKKSSNYEANEEEEDNRPIDLINSDNEEELSRSTDTVTNGESLVDINEWSDDTLKSWLHQVRINKEYNNTMEDTNSLRKKSALPKILLILTLYPLLNQCKTILTSYNLFVNINITQFLFKIIYLIQNFLLNK